MYDLIAQLFVFIFALVYAVILVGLIIFWVRNGRGNSKKPRARRSAPPPSLAPPASSSSVLESLSRGRE